MVIHANSNQELAQLAELLLSKFKDFNDLQNKAACCDGGTSGTSVIVNNQNPFVLTDDAVFLVVSGLRAQFTVGDQGAPPNGTASFFLIDELGVRITGMDIDMFRERFYQIPGDDYTYDFTTGTINLFVPFFVNTLGKGERIVIFIRPKKMYDTFRIGTPSGNTGFPYTFPAAFG
jgi:hypothetical protein